MTHFSKIILALALSLTACVRPQSHRTDATATFILSEVKATSTVTKLVDGFSIPSARLYNFTVCASDMRNHETIKRSEFTISGGSRELRQRSDESGCLNWSETIPFNMLADERYLDFTRTITAHGMSTGSRDIHVAINPWKISKSDEVVDLNFKSVPEDQVVSKAAMGSPKSLKISKFYVENSAHQSVPVLVRKLKGFIQPSISLVDMTGQLNDFPLVAANLKISIDIYGIANAGGVESKSLISSESNLPLVKDGDNWTFEFKTTVGKSNVNTRYQWAVRLDPINGPENLKSFSGLYSAGDFATLTGSTSIPMSLRDANYQPLAAIGSLTQSVAAAQNSNSVANSNNSPAASAPLKVAGPRNVPADDASDDSVSTRAFQISEIKPEWLAVQSETAVIRTVRYRATTCITDNANAGRPAVDVDFKVEIGEGASKRQMAIIKRRGGGMDGCISWEDTLTHRYYETEKFMMITATITHQPSGFVEVRRLGLNPWDRLNFGFDEKIGKSLFKQLENRTAPSARMVADSYQFDTVSTRNYGVDSFLNLRILKRVQFRISVRVQRHSNILSGKATNTEALRDGIYLYRALINVNARSATGEKTELFSPMLGKQKLARVIGGDVKVFGDFNLGDPKIMRARANIIFEILPVDESKLSEDEKSTLALANTHSFDDIIDRNSGMITPTFVGPVWAGDEGGFAAVFPTDLPISGSYKSFDVAENTRAIAGQTYSQIMERARASQTDYVRRMSDLRSLPTYLKNGNLEYVALNNDAAIRAATPGLEANNEVLPKTNSVDRLLAFMNYKIPDGTPNGVDQKMMMPEPATSKTMQDIIEGRKAIDLPVAAHLCQMFMTDFVGKVVPSPRSFFQDCLMSVASGRPVFTMDRVVRVIENDGGQFVPGQQPTISFNLGADLSFGRSAGWSASWSPSGIINTIPLLSSVWGALGLSASYNRGTNGGEGTHFGSGTSLTMENVGLDIKATRYETCAAIRIDPTYWEARQSRIRSATLTGEKLARALSRGVLICSGVEALAPLSLHEDFYSFAQGALDQTSLDKGDIGNLPWLISLRGNRDYVTFLSFISAKNGPKNDPSLVVNVGGYPMDQLKEAYAHYRSHLGTQPGFYIYPATAEKPAVAKPWWNPFA